MLDEVLDPEFIQFTEAPADVSNFPETFPRSGIEALPSVPTVTDPFTPVFIVFPSVEELPSEVPLLKLQDQDSPSDVEKLKLLFSVLE